MRVDTVGPPMIALASKLALRLSLLSCFASAAFGCGGKTVGEVMIPESPVAHEVRGQQHVTAVAGSGEPLIVDWEPEARTDMEVQMRDGVTVVAYSGEGLRLLKDCSVDGTYGFVQVSPKEQVIRLESKDEVSANLPTSGAAMFRIEGGVGRARGIEIAMHIVGKFRTTRRRVNFTMLRGSCDGATHFVRGATVGAFAMRSASGGWANSAAEVFGAGARGSAEGARAVENRDGDPAACKDDSPQALLEGCGALLRLELVRLSENVRRAATEEEGAPEEEALSTACPEGFVQVGGKCSRPDDGAAYTCSPDNVSDCHRQCDAGDARSCVIAGVRARDGKAEDASPERTRELFERACRAKDALGCTLLGDMYRFGSGVRRDVLKAGSYYTQACEDAVPAACRQLATMYYYGDGLTPDLGRAVELYERGCDAGDEQSCSLLGDLFMTSAGDFHEPARAVSLFRRACQGEDVAGCVSEVRAIEFGVGTEPDVPDAIARKHRLCDRHPALCGQLGINYLAGRGVQKNVRAAEKLLERACASLPNQKPTEAWGEVDLYAFYACLISESRFGRPGASESQKATMAGRVAPVLQLIASRCTQESLFECFDGGHLFALAGHDEGARTLWTKGCELQNGECCDALENDNASSPPAPHPEGVSP